MSGWGLGDGWGLGLPWGADNVGEEYGCALAQSGILSQSQGGNFSLWMCAFGEEIGSNFDTLVDITNAFNIETAVGVQLDVIGALVGLPRSGSDDNRYRTFLAIQSELLLSAVTGDGNWTGTTQNIINICRRFIGVGSGDPIIAVTQPPYAFTLTVPDISLFEMEILASFLRKAIYLGILGHTVFVPEGDNLYCYEIAADTPNAGIYCYEVAADTANAGLYSALVLIGDP